MAVANLNERLLFFAKQESFINNQLSNLQMQQFSASRKASTSQLAYNETLKELYYDENVGYGTEEYTEILVQLQNDHEFEMASLTAWETQLEAQKEAYETQLTELTNYKNSWQKMLQTNIKSDFTYGSSGGGK